MILFILYYVIGVITFCVDSYKDFDQISLQDLIFAITVFWFVWPILIISRLIDHYTKDVILFQRKK